MIALIDVHIYIACFLTLINASVSKRSYLVLCLPSTARTEERAGGDMRFSQKHLVLIVIILTIATIININTASINKLIAVLSFLFPDLDDTKYC